MTSDRDLGPDPGMEARVGAWLEDTDLSPQEAERGLDGFLEEFPVTPQARRRFLGRWLDRDEGARRRTGDHDQPPDTRRTKIMFSATGLVAAFAILALAVNVLPTSDQTLPPDAGTGSTFSVASDGSGDFGTISEAVAAAADGDIVMVKPGTYTEAVLIDKAITLMGDGPREDIVIEAPAEPLLVAVPDEEPFELEHFGLVVLADASISGMTLEGPIEIEAWDDTGAFGVHVFGAKPAIEDLLLAGGPSIQLHSAADGARIADNTIDGAESMAIGAWGTGNPTISGNVIIGPGRSAIEIFEGPAVVTDNVISDVRVARGISIAREADGSVVTGNVLTDVKTGIAWNAPEGTVQGNEISGGDWGLVIAGGAPAVRDNTIDGAEEIGLWVYARTAPVLSGNAACDNAVDVTYERRSNPQDDGTNDFCVISEEAQ